MRLKLIAISLFLSVFALLWRQVQQNGELKAVNAQYQAAVEDLNTAINDLADRNKKTFQVLADTHRQFQITQQKAWSLSNDLQNLPDDCASSVIDKSVVDRVRQYTDD
ncbi:hypothetical protein [Amphritea sp. HPY]|uniref:hypothetical protein n=1 Tax=Amphritea sp. HPY TaxID=3421652 RepID=UPI003D7EB0CA